MINFFRLILDLISDYVSLFALERQLAKKSLIPAGLSLIFFVTVSLGVWISLVSLAGYGFYSWSKDLFLTLLVVLGFNLGALLVSFFVFLLFFRRLTFRRTRTHLGSFKNSSETTGAGKAT